MKKLLLTSLQFFLIILFTSNSFAQQYWDGTATAISSAKWASTSGGTYNLAYQPNVECRFDVVSGAFIGASVAVSQLTILETPTFTAGGTMSSANPYIIIDVASGKTLDFTGQNLSTSSTTTVGLTKNGSGELGWNGGTNTGYKGGFILNNGTIVAKGINTFGQSSTSVLTINGGKLASNANYAFTTSKLGSIIIGGDFQLGATTGLALSTANLSFDAPVSLGSASRNITLSGTGTNTFTGIISGTSSAGIGIANGSTGSLVLSGANTYPGSTTITGGTLILGGSGVIPDGSNLVLTGGTFKSGTTTGFSETMGMLDLEANSTLTLGTGAHTLNFSNSSSLYWAYGTTLTITGWTGGYDRTSGTGGKIIVGSDNTGLTGLQLSQIKFYNGSTYYPATILSNGEVVPTNTLSISLNSFTGTAVDKSILLNWKTASEENNDYFDVQHSADGKTFSSIGKVTGAGTSTSENSYSFKDENPFSGTNYYKLVQHDFDGKTSSSIVIPVDSKIAAAQLSVYAASSDLKITLSSPNKTEGTFEVFDIRGRKLASQSVDINKGYNTFSLPVSLQPGVHFIRYTSEGVASTVKFMR